MNCFDWIDFEREGRRREDEAGRCVASVFAMISLANEFELELVAEAQPAGALQIVEPVAVLQLLELVLEHEVEGRAEQPAERHLLLGQAADPEVDVAETGAWYAVQIPRCVAFSWPTRRCC